MDFVDEQDVALLQIGQERGEIACFGDDRTGGSAKIDAKLARHDLSQCCLAEARWTDEQDMIERLAAAARRLDEYAEVFACLLLADKFGQPLRAQTCFSRVFVAPLRRHQLVSGVCAHPSDPRLYLFGNKSPIGTTAGDLPFGTITRARGS